MSGGEIVVVGDAKLQAELSLAAKRAQEQAQQAMTLKVFDSESCVVVAELGLRIKRKIKEEEDRYAPLKRKAKEAHQTICDSERAVLAPYQQALRYLDNQVTAWRKEQERIADERRRQAEAEERARIEQSRKAQAAAAEAAGKSKLAEAIKAAPIPTPKVAITSTVPMLSGTRKIEHWRARVVDAALVPREWCDPSDGKGGNRLGQYARDNKEKAVGTVPGVEFYSESSTF